jgi:hypothetical protein
MPLALLVAPTDPGAGDAASRREALAWLRGQLARYRFDIVIAGAGRNPRDAIEKAAPTISSGDSVLVHVSGRLHGRDSLAFGPAGSVPLRLLSQVFAAQFPADLSFMLELTYEDDPIDPLVPHALLASAIQSLGAQDHGCAVLAAVRRASQGAGRIDFTRAVLGPPEEGVVVPPSEAVLAAMHRRAMSAPEHRAAADGFLFISGHASADSEAGDESSEGHARPVRVVLSDDIEAPAPPPPRSPEVAAAPIAVNPLWKDSVDPPWEDSAALDADLDRAFAPVAPSPESHAPDPDPSDRTDPRAPEVHLVEPYGAGRSALYSDPTDPQAAPLRATDSYAEAPADPEVLAPSQAHSHADHEVLAPSYAEAPADPEVLAPLYADTHADPGVLLAAPSDADREVLAAPALGVADPHDAAAHPSDPDATDPQAPALRAHPPTSDDRGVQANRSAAVPDAPLVVPFDPGPGVDSPHPGVNTPDRGLYSSDRGVYSPDPGVYSPDPGARPADPAVRVAPPPPPPLADAGALDGIEAASFRTPLTAAPYRIAYEIHRRQGNVDAAMLAAMALEELSSAQPDQQALVNQFRSVGPARMRCPLDPASWAMLRAPGFDDAVAALFTAIERAAVAVRLDELREARRLPILDREQRLSETSTASVVRSFQWAARVLGLRCPDLYAMDDAPGAAMMHAAEPSTALGRTVLSGQSAKDLAFLAGRHLTYYRPEHHVLLYYPTRESLTELLLATVQVGMREGGSSTLPPGVQSLRARLTQRLGNGARASLIQAIRVLDARGGQAKVGAWMRGVELTAARVGLVLCGDLATAASFLRTQPGGVAELSNDERRGDLIAFCASRVHAAVRARCVVTGASELAASPNGGGQRRVAS